MVYRFIDKNKEQFGLRWLCRHFKISLNCYYNYLKDTKRDYYEQRFMVYERIKYIYYNNNRTIGYRLMKIFLQRYGIYLSTTTIHKYMNKDLNLSAIVMRKKPGYKSCKKHKIFDNLLKQKFNVDEKIRSGALILHICASLMVSFDITVPLWIYLTDLL